MGWISFLYISSIYFLSEKKGYLLSCNYTDFITYRSKITFPWMKFLRFLSRVFPPPSPSPLSPANKKGRRWSLNAASNLPDERTWARNVSTGLAAENYQLC